MQFTCKDLFRNGDTAYLPIGEGVKPQAVEKRILSWAFYHGHDVRFSCGVWAENERDYLPDSVENCIKNEVSIFEKALRNYIKTKKG